MSENSLKYISQLSNYLKVSIGKLQVNEAQLPTCVIDNITNTGFSNIVFRLLKHSSRENLIGKTREDEAEIRQWLEYSLIYAMNNDTSQNLNQILREINGVLASKTYLVSHLFTVADVILYYILQKPMMKLTYLDKEKYINLSRWFDNVQQVQEVRQSYELVDFGTNYLTRIIPIKS